MNGIIVKAIGGIYYVEASRWIFIRKSLNFNCCLDKTAQLGFGIVMGYSFEFSLEDDGSGVIEKIEERRSLLIRPPLANLDMLVFVSSTCEPRPNLLLLDKFIAIAVFKKIEPVVVFTKIDKESCDGLVDIYKGAGIKTFQVDNTTGEGSEAVKAVLEGKLSAFTGNTGVGKSSLLNNMFPALGLATNEISKKLGRGKHTTRHVELYKLEGGGYIADTPGFSSFDTNRYDIIFKDKLAGCFPEFQKYEGKCRFPDCSHTKEKGCAVIEAVKNGEIAKSRHESYVEMYEQAKQLKEWEYKND